MFKWKNFGKIFDPTKDSSLDWMQEFSQIPTAIELDQDTLRVYFACRPKRDSDMQYISRSGFVDVLKEDLSKVVNISTEPIMELGPPGSFDEFGSMTSSFVRVGSEIYGYYTGWTRMQSVPYNMAVGVGISSDGGLTFKKIGEGPILGQTLNEPYVLSGPIVKYIQGQWHMWYLLGLKWILHEGKYEPVYRISHATSEDGINWKRNGKLVIPALTEDECQVSFGLFHKNGCWHVLFAFRKPLDFRDNSEHAYRLGYASSDDLETWVRDDSKAGISVSKSGWDSNMICYPSVFEFDERTVMFYCGNNFGRNGFGCAELVND